MLSFIFSVLLHIALGGHLTHGEIGAMGDIVNAMASSNGK